MDDTATAQTVVPPPPSEPSVAPVPAAHPAGGGNRWISFFLLLIVLAAIPVSVIYLGQKTRQELKAAEQCKTPQIPDPNECAGGDWKLYQNETGCIRFRCEQ